ncbi:9776_t:CDS:1, partial [Funneliformis geosporum]
NKSSITIQIPTNTHNLIKGGNTSLHTLIPKRYKEFAVNLRKYSLLFIKQISYSHGQSLLTFADFSVYQNTPHLRQIPTWFTKLQELFSNPNSCELRQRFSYSKESHFDFAQPKKIPGKQSFILE